MKLDSKRLFISDLPQNITESDVKEKFSSYGNVASIEIKHRKEIGSKNVSPMFCFVNINIDKNSLDSCFEEFSNKKWKGNYVNLQMAKESFLDRLKKEREEANKVKVPTSLNNPVELDKNFGLNKSNSNEYHITSDEDKSYKVDISKQVVNGTNNKVNKFDLSEKNVLNIQESKKFKTKELSVSSEESVKGNNLKESKEEMKNGTDEFKTINNRSKLLNGILKIESFGYEPLVIKDVKKSKLKAQEQTEADKKRIQSIIEMRKGYQQQKSLIKASLSTVDSKRKNKIIFDDDLDTSILPKRKKNVNNKTENIKRKQLFDDVEDNTQYNFEIKEQFQGKKGRKLLELQSKYKNDKRFLLSDKFLDEDDEDEDENVEEDRKQNEENVDEITIEEKEKQLAILEDVVGKKLVSKGTDFNTKSEKTKLMLRFDPTLPEHSKYELKIQGQVIKKKKAKESMEKDAEVEDKIPVVSKDTFYKVTDDLKEGLEENQPFSLLEMFGRTQGELENAETTNVHEEKKNRIFNLEKNPFKYDSTDESDGENENDTLIKEQTSNDQHSKETEKVCLGGSGLWSEPFFFKNNDLRFKEGLDFVRGFEAEDVSEFTNIRRNLKMFVKAKVQKHKRRNEPFQKKLGGRRMHKQRIARRK